MRLNSKSLQLFYYRHKDTPVFIAGIFGSIIIVCIFLAWFVIIPQIQNWFSIRHEIEEKRKKISIIKNNIQYIDGLNSNALDRDLRTVTSAIPPGRDFTGVLNAVFISAANAGIVLDDFTFEVGEIPKASSSALPRVDTKPESIAQESLEELPVISKKSVQGDAGLPLRITLTFKDSITKVKVLLKEVNKKIPLAEIESIKLTSEKSSIIIAYAYKDFPPIVIDNSVPVAAVSSERVSLVQQLESWDDTVTDYVTSSTNSGELSAF